MGDHHDTGGEYQKRNPGMEADMHGKKGSNMREKRGKPYFELLLLARLAGRRLVLTKGRRTIIGRGLAS